MSIYNTSINYSCDETSCNEFSYSVKTVATIGCFKQERLDLDEITYHELLVLLGIVLKVRVHIDK